MNWIKQGGRYVRMKGRLLWGNIWAINARNRFLLAEQQLEKANRERKVVGVKQRMANARENERNGRKYMRTAFRNWNRAARLAYKMKKWEHRERIRSKGEDLIEQGFDIRKRIKERAQKVK